ncbi:MAG: 4Fe-4S binding protein [Planctomycetes bacterium]|nr:4Fe-4S binding protein [Planctomycetota bacterium]
MAVMIQEECVSCGLCLEVCPDDCILEEAEKFGIDRDRCSQCGDCIPACPLACIVVV